MNFGRRWRVPKLVLAIPGSAEFLARASAGGMAEARGYNKGASPSLPSFPHQPNLASPRLASPCRASPRSAPLRLYRRRRRRCRAPARPLARSRFAGWCDGTLLPYIHRQQLGIGKGRPRDGARWRAQARGSNGKKSAGLTNGGWSSYRSRANIGDRERCRADGYNRDAATMTAIHGGSGE